MTGGSEVANVVKKKIKELQTELEKLQFDVIAEDETLKHETGLREKAEAEVAAMTRRIRLLEEDLEVSSSRLTETLTKLEEASKTAEESERTWRQVQNKMDTYDKKVEQLKKAVEDATEAAKETDKKYKEISCTLALTEKNLAEAEIRMAKSEELVAELENALKNLAAKWKSMEIKKEQSAEIEKNLEERINVLTHHVKEAEYRADSAEAGS
uniref:Clone ZZZ89 mRNA sequence n=1 Tax=Schistosoma japonicum TaxID=6182 RepID=Q86DU9_SCHJA|nr:similar to GenBank Accession Number L76202 Schistosoma haematobium tropomyosin [Schistosoma japonicum]